jgi:hypothetical protein
MKFRKLNQSDVSFRTRRLLQAGEEPAVHSISRATNIISTDPHRFLSRSAQKSGLQPLAEVFYCGKARFRNSTRSFTVPIALPADSARTAISFNSFLFAASAEAGKLTSTRAAAVCFAPIENFPAPLCTVQPAGKSPAKVISCAAEVGFRTHNGITRVVPTCSAISGGSGCGK